MTDTVRDLALAAYRVREEERAAKAEQATEDERKAQRRRVRKATATLKASPLQEWFPGQEWDVMSYSSRGAAEGYSDGEDIVVAPRDRSVYLLLQGRDDKVFAVQHKLDVGMSAFNTGYGYWDGPEVKSAADVGLAIKNLEAHR